MSFVVGDLVWIPATDDETAAYVPGVVEGFDCDKVKVKASEGGKSYTIDVAPSSIHARFLLDANATKADVTSLVHMNEPSILDNLVLRHEQDKPYTYTASVLLAVNPYKQIDGLYGEEQCELYRGKHIGVMPPHPYAIADTAYRTLVREQRHQALLISGESGAGKTETAKIVMQYLAYASGAASELASNIQELVLRAQPILESFGNAVTLRNSNSSRFGKYNRIFFDKKGTLADAGINTYLLESSRVVVHGERERTYHVFYEMLFGVGEEKLGELKLDKAKKYHLLHGSGGVPGLEDRDRSNFHRLCDALRVVGLDDAAIDRMLQVVAGLVHLGDIPADQQAGEMPAVGASPRPAKDEDEESDATQEVNDESVENAAAMLGMDPDELCDLLKRRTIKIKGRDSMHKVPRTASQFRQTLHSMIKALYKRLFEHTVSIINEKFKELRRSGEATDVENHIGILDIYGFERLQKNSFEQLCINLANERLQQFFVVNVLSAEEKMYEREGLPWAKLTLPDSTPVVSCVNQCFKTLDDFSSRLAKGLPTGGDEKFCEKVTEEAAKDATTRDLLKRPRATGGRRASAGLLPNEGFILKHYAGPVEYNTRGWMDKNNDRLLLECEELIQDSENPLVKALGEEDTRTTFRSISKKYATDLEALLETLGTCNLHYIRCFKPNSQQKPRIVEKSLLLDQIVQCGTIELVKIMHDGYPNRCDFDSITSRFKELLPERFKSLNTRTFVDALMQAYEVPEADWRLGMSRLFLKAGQLQALEAMRSEGKPPKTETLERILRQIIRKRWTKCIHAVRLCVWIPKFIRELNVRKATKHLRTVAVVTSRLAPRLAEARRKVEERRLRARRRFVGAARATLLANALWRAAKARRRERVATCLHRAALLAIHLRPRIAKARALLADASARQEAERKREAERLRAEMERRLEEERTRMEEQRREEEQRQEQERTALEAQRLQAEELAAEERRVAEESLKEERRLMDEERQRLEELRSSAAEATAKATAEEEARRRDSERAQIEEARRQLDEERRQLDEEKRLHRTSVTKLMAQTPTPTRHASKQDRPRDSLASSFASSSVPAGASATAATGLANELDEIGPMDSASQAFCHGQRSAGTTPEVQAAVQKEMQSQIQNAVSQLEQTFMAKQNEVLEQMRLLQLKNESLEKQVNDGNLLTTPAKSNASGLDGNTPARRNPSLLTIDGTPRCQPSPRTPLPSTGKKSKADPQSAMSKSSRRYSLLSLDATGSGAKSRRARVSASEALLQYAAPGGDGAAAPEGQLPPERRFWAEQRANLLEELYPHGSPFHGAPGANPQTGARSRLSTGGGATQRLESKFEEEAEEVSAPQSAKAPPTSGREPRPSSAGRLRQPQIFAPRKK